MSQWTEESAARYRQLAMVAVPARDEQIASLLTLLPFSTNEAFHLVELASGEGYLAAAILKAFPNATLLALDRSPSMLQATEARLKPLGKRGLVAPFDLASSEWHRDMKDADAVVSSLCIHHLDGPQKQELFKAIRENLSGRGVFLNADIVEPRHEWVRNFFAQTLDHDAKVQSNALVGSDELFDLFVAEEWDYYRYPSDVDKPSTLFDQLMWLQSAGFVGVDCFWMRAGHTIFGGFMREGHALPEEDRLSFEDALAIARSTLGMKG